MPILPKNYFSNCGIDHPLSKIGSILMSHESGLTPHESGWIPHESGLKQHDTVKIRGLPHGKIKLKKCALKNSHKNGLPTVF